MIHVPYRGGEQAATDAMAGQIEMVSMGLASASRRRGRQTDGCWRDRAEPASALSRCADHGGIRPARGAHGHLVQPRRAAAYAGGDRGAARSRHRRRSSSEQGFRDGLAKIGCALAYLPHADFAAFIADDVTKWRKLIPAMGIPQID